MSDNAGGVKGSLRTVAVRAGSFLLGRQFGATLSDMDRAQWLPPDKLRARAEARLGPLLEHAARNVPFYGQVYRKLRLAPDRLRTIEDLRLLPVVSKNVHRQHAADYFLAANLPSWRRVPERTSGSAGQPFPFFLDRQSMPALMASHVFSDAWFGLRPFDRSVRIGGRRPRMPQARVPPGVRLRALLTRRLRSAYEGLTQEAIAAWDVRTDRVPELLRRIEEFRPAYIIGYGSAIAALADELLRLGLRPSVPLRGVIVEAEPLPPPRRQSIERCFQAPVGNRYGPREFGSYNALSCPEAPEQFHVNTELAIWETLRPDGTPAGPGETGRVVLTDLYNYVMPFLRYDTGVLATPGLGCRCGRGFPVVRGIEGRSFEVVWTPAGQAISPAVLTNYLFVARAHGDFVRQCQLVQDGPAEMRLLVVPAPGFDQERRAGLRDDLAALLEHQVAVTVETVHEIPCEPSGKRPLVKPLAGTAAAGSAPCGAGSQAGARPSRPDELGTGGHECPRHGRVSV